MDQWVLHALRVPSDKIPQNFDKTARRERPILVYCFSKGSFSLAISRQQPRAASLPQPDINDDSMVRVSQGSLL